MKFRSALGAMGLSLVVSSPALAHPQGASDIGGFAAGFVHPWLGLDHLLAMVAVGLLGVQLGSRALWLLPCTFLGTMILGGALGMAGPGIPFIELGIAVSVIGLGLALASGRKYPLVAAAAVVGAVGIMHGHAHGTELPALAAPALYVAGFTAATALLHFAGIASGLAFVRNRRWQSGLRWSGGFMAAAGVALLFGAI